MRTVVFVAILAFIGGMHAGGYLEREHGARRSAERQSGLNGSGSTVRRWLGASVESTMSAGSLESAGNRAVHRRGLPWRFGSRGLCREHGDALLHERIAEGPASDKVETEITVCHSVPPPIFRLRPAALPMQIPVLISAYNAESSQTDSTPDRGAWNDNLWTLRAKGLIVLAISRDLEAFVPPGTILIVADRMAAEKRNQVDIHFILKKDALQWGLQRGRIVLP